MAGSRSSFYRILSIQWGFAARWRLLLRQPLGKSYRYVYVEKRRTGIAAEEIAIDLANAIANGGTMYRSQNKKVFAAVACATAMAVAASSASARVIGEDGRRTVSQEERQRYSAIGIVVVSDGRRVYGGTGTLINDAFTVLTAFHNVFHDGKTGPIGQVKAPLRMMHLVVGDRLTYYPIKSIRPFNRSYDGFVLPDENDLAVLTLQKPVVGVQPLTLRALGSEEDGRELDHVTLVAYAGLKKHVQACSFHARAGSYPRSADVLVHDCDSEGNASGAPFLDASGAIVAIHLGGSPRGLKLPGLPFNARSNFNIARRITSEVRHFVGKEPRSAPGR